jgi:hypothetical protein
VDVAASSVVQVIVAVDPEVETFTPEMVGGVVSPAGAEFCVKTTSTK